MFAIRGVQPPCYRRLSAGEFSLLDGLELDADQIDRFLGPIPDIVTAVRRGPAHHLVAIELADGLAGFYVVHPEPRDAACWWLGWLALDRRRQGLGLGRAAMAAVMQRLRAVPHCRRVRLLVAPDNLRARQLYGHFGFHAVGRLPSTGELILEAALPSPVEEDGLRGSVLVAVVARARRVFRHRRLRLTSGPHPAWVIGVERGPPSQIAPHCYARPQTGETPHGRRGRMARPPVSRAESGAGRTGGLRPGRRARQAHRAVSR